MRSVSLSEASPVDRAEFGGEIGKNEKLRILGADLLAAAVRERNFARTLADREIKLFFQLLSLLLADFGKHLHLAVFMQFAYLGILEKMHKLLVLRHRMVDLVDLRLSRFQISRLKSFFRSLDEVVALRSLNADDRVDQRTDLLVDVARRNRSGPGNDQRRSRLVDQNRVDLVDDREVMTVLNYLFGTLGHSVVA